MAPGLHYSIIILQACGWTVGSNFAELDDSADDVLLKLKEDHAAFDESRSFWDLIGGVEVSYSRIA
jgi:hypothetical protein